MESGAKRTREWRGISPGVSPLMGLGGRSLLNQVKKLNHHHGGTAVAGIVPRVRANSTKEPGDCVLGSRRSRSPNDLKLDPNRNLSYLLPGHAERRATAPKKRTAQLPLRCSYFATRLLGRNSVDLGLRV